MFQRLSITQRIFLITVGGFTLASGALAAYIYLTLSDNIGQLLISEQQEKAEIIAAYSSKALDQRTELLQTLTPYLHDGQRLIPPQEMAELLEGIVTIKQAFNGGLMISNAIGIGVGEAPAGSSRIGLDISRREHLRIARETRQPVITRPLIATHARRPSFFINVPIISETDEVIGFLIGITFLEVDNFLVPSTRLVRSDSQFYILDPANNLIVTANDFSLAMAPIPDSGVIPVVDAALAGNPSGAVTDADGTRLLYASAGLPEMGWIIVKTFPEKAVLAPIVTLVRHILLTAVILLFGLGLLLLWQLTRMLTPLRNAIDNIDARVNDLKTVEAIPVESDDEVGKLVQAFNRLLSSREDQRQRLYLATSGTGIGIWDYDIEHQHMHWDDIMYQLYGVDTGECQDLYQAWHERVHHDDLAWVNRSLQDTIKGDAVFDTEFRVVLSDGRVRWIKANAIVLRDEQDKPLRIIGTNWDITERKRVELMKNQFVSTVSHELRTPLTSISGSLGLIVGGAVGELPPQSRQLVEIAYKNSQRLGHLINDLLDMEKIAAGKMRFDMVMQELMPIVEQALEANEAYARQYDVTCQLVERAEDMLVRVDAQRLEQVLSNLLSNAAKFSPTGETVEVAIGAQRDKVRIEIRDRGPGISREFRSRLFTKFSQADSSDARQKGGTGLGLAITKELVERMGGSVGVNSEVGKGSVFFFELPAVHRESFSDKPSASTEIDGATQRILVVEDDPDVARLLADMLQQNGYHTDIAYNGAQAVALVEQMSYAAVTLDLQLPDRNGVSIIRQLRTHSATAHIPIVVVAGNVEEGQLALNGGFNAIDWLQKPIDQQTLLESIRRAAGASDDKPLVLHIEDDEDIRSIISLVGQDMAIFHAASTMLQARQQLEENIYDVVILDIGLPDGSGWDLLPLIKKQTRIPQIIVLSGQELSADQLTQVDQALLKTPTSVQELIEILIKIPKGDKP